MIKALKHTLLAAAVAAATVGAQAAAPMVKTPAPGFYRVMVGDIEVTPVSDGTVDMPMDQYLRQKPELTRAAVARHFLKLPVETSDNAFLHKYRNRHRALAAAAKVPDLNSNILLTGWAICC